MTTCKITSNIVLALLPIKFLKNNIINVPDKQMNREEQLKIFSNRTKRSLEAEDLFYTSSKYKFRGSLKLWLSETENAFFSDHEAQETNFFVSKNRVVSSRNQNNSDQDKNYTTLFKSRQSEIGVQSNNGCYLF